MDWTIIINIRLAKGMDLAIFITDHAFIENTDAFTNSALLMLRPCVMAAGCIKTIEKKHFMNCCIAYVLLNLSPSELTLKALITGHEVAVEFPPFAHLQGGQANQEQTEIKDRLCKLR